MNNNIGKNATQITITKFINIAIGMINAMILSRYRTLEEFGTFSQLNIVIALLTTVTMMGLPGSINYFLAKADNNKERSVFLSNYYSISTILSVFTGILLLIGMPYIVKYFKNELIFSFGFYLLFMPWINIIGGSIGNLLIVYNKIRYLSIYNIGSSIITLGVLLISVIFNMSFLQYMYITVSTQILVTLFIYFVAYRIAGGMYPLINKSLLNEILKFSIPLGLASIVGTLHIESDKLLIGYFFDTETMAVYTNAAREMPVKIIASSFTAVLMPHLVRLLKENKNEEAISIWSETNLFSYIFVSFFATALFVFAPEVISLLYSDKYLHGVSVFRVYNIVLLITFTYYGMILNSIGKTKLIFYSSIASLGINVVLNYIFLKLLGVIGPAIATVVSTALVAIFQLIATTKYVQINFRRILPWRKLIIITIINVIMGFIFYLIKLNIPLDYLIGETFESIILGIFWTLLYSLVMFKSVKKIWLSINK